MGRQRGPPAGHAPHSLAVSHDKQAFSSSSARPSYDAPPLLARRGEGAGKERAALPGQGHDQCLALVLVRAGGSCHTETPGRLPRAGPASLSVSTGTLPSRGCHSPPAPRRAESMTDLCSVTAGQRAAASSPQQRGCPPLVWDVARHVTWHCSHQKSACSRVAPGAGVSPRARRAGHDVLSMGRAATGEPGRLSQQPGVQGPHGIPAVLQPDHRRAEDLGQRVGDRPLQAPHGSRAPHAAARDASRSRSVTAWDQQVTSGERGGEGGATGGLGQSVREPSLPQGHGAWATPPHWGWQELWVVGAARGSPATSRGGAPHSSTLRWSQGLSSRSVSLAVAPPVVPQQAL